MSVLPANQASLITFVILDSDGIEVIGLDDAFTLQVSKNGGAFAAGTGVKAEVGSGWYSYGLTAEETDTAGPLAVVVTALGADQVNLIYEIRPYGVVEPAGATILTAAEAASILRCLTTDEQMLQLLPQVDAYIWNATGWNWTVDATIRPEAKAAARILLVRAHEDPGALAQTPAALSWGLSACLLQLETLAMRYKHFQGRTDAGPCDLPGVAVGDTVDSLVGLIGVSGDQASAFEEVITVADQIQQISTSDLSANWYRAYLVPVESHA